MEAVVVGRTKVEPRYVCSSYPPLSAKVSFVIYKLANVWYVASKPKPKTHISYLGLNNQINFWRQMHIRVHRLISIIPSSLMDMWTECNCRRTTCGILWRFNTTPWLKRSGTSTLRWPASMDTTSGKLSLFHSSTLSKNYFYSSTTNILNTLDAPLSILNNIFLRLPLHKSESFQDSF